MASTLSPHAPITKATIHAGEPSYHTTGDTENTQRHVAYDIIFTLIVLLFILIVIYTSYMCNRIKSSRSPPPPPTTTSDSDTDDFHSIVLSTGLQDYILSTFPTFVYSEATKPRKVDNETGTGEVSTYDSSCHVCLTDYESMDVLRLLPECGHLFHMSCIDTWLMVHPTCPVCRNSPIPTSSELNDSSLTSNR